MTRPIIIHLISWVPLIVLLAIGVLIPPMANKAFGTTSGWLSAGVFSTGVVSAGLFSAGVSSAGLFSVGIFSAGLFSMGIFSFGTFVMGVWAAGQCVRGRFINRLSSWGHSVAHQQPPHWQPTSALPRITSLIDGMLHDREARGGAAR
jgi:hypothetical protein